MNPNTQGLSTNSQGEAVLLSPLMELLDVKQEAFRDLGRALVVARDTLQPLADNKPLSMPAQRALVTMALMSLSQAAEAFDELAAIGESRDELRRRQGGG